MEERISQQRQQNIEIVEQIKQHINNSTAMVIIDYKGLTVAQDTEFRKAFREQNVEYKVLKNTLVRIALNELGYTEFDSALNGTTAVAFAKGDALAAAKVAVDSISKYNAMAVKCGMIDKKFIDADAVQAYAKVPSKPALLSMLLSVLQAPIRGLAVALNRVAEKQNG
ncbi:MAG: 50S ribosomal protein L10 [Clostridia bacterium]|nr:50S ribosomal protein L10 [Clostridia bacterium]